MNSITLLFFLLWLAAGVLVVRFVLRTGGTRFGKPAHWFGGFFTMIGLAIGLTWIFAQIDSKFGTHVNVYVLTHQIRPGDTVQLIERPERGNPVTVYRRGSMNTTATIEGDRLIIDERQTVRTSVWWVLFDSKYTNP